MEGTLYFHAPCFDGIVSAVLLSDFLRAKRGWSEIELKPVNYKHRDNWLATNFDTPTAVVDFLYHPQAEFWADHHPTTFLRDEDREAFHESLAHLIRLNREHLQRCPPASAQATEARRKSEEKAVLVLKKDLRQRLSEQETVRWQQEHVFGPSAKSCAGLLWEHLHEPPLSYRNPRFASLIAWAEKTDSADYESVREAIFGDAPALRISKSLGGKDNQQLCETLVRALGRMSLEEVAALPDVTKRFERIRADTDAGLDRFEKCVEMDENGIALFDVDIEGVNINRYAPYHFHPEARYSLGILRWNGGAKITAMRNPWPVEDEGPGIHLGDLFKKKTKGGGHERVASVELEGEQLDKAAELRDTLLEAIKGKGGPQDQMVN